MTDPRRLPSMVQGLEYLKGRGVPIDFVLDVGVLSCTFPLMQCFPTSRHILVEPVRAYYDNIRRIYAAQDIDYRLFECAAGDRDGTLVLCEYAKKGGEEVTHSQIVGSVGEAPQADLLRTTDVHVRRVDSLIAECRQSGLARKDDQYLFKLDVDGVEESIIEGARGCLAECSVVVLEIPLRKINTRLALLDSLGYELMDIVDPCYYRGALSQIDGIFVRSDLVNRFGVDPWRVSGSIDFGQWYEGRYAHVG